ncbi:MAG: hypothetical protein NTZ13_01500 [Candidatus Parcubacteria bacterium]|nr:hypothetical protein [Candidatus Parcubacteria bacterium]
MPFGPLIVRLLIALGAMFYGFHKVGPPTSSNSNTTKKKWLQKSNKQ